MLVLALMFVSGSDMVSPTAAQVWENRRMLCERITKEGRRFELVADEVAAHPELYGSLEDARQTCITFDDGRLAVIAAQLDAAADKIRREVEKAGLTRK